MGSCSKLNAAKQQKMALAKEEALNYAFQLHIKDQNKPPKERQSLHTLCHLTEQDMKIRTR